METDSLNEIALKASSLRRLSLTAGMRFGTLTISKEFRKIGAIRVSNSSRKEAVLDRRRLPGKCGRDAGRDEGSFKVFQVNFFELRNIDYV